MLYNLYLQPKWRKKTDTSEEISHIRWYTDVFGVVSWFSQLFHQTLIPHLLSLGWKVSEKAWGTAASSCTIIKTWEAREAQWCEWKDKMLAGTHPPQAILPLQSYLTGDCTWTKMSSTFSSRCSSCCQTSLGEDAECHYFWENYSLKAFCWTAFLSHKHVLQFRPEALATTKQTDTTHLGTEQDKWLVMSLLC